MKTKTEKATKMIKKSGDSLVINVTQEVRRLGLTRGDLVDITLTPYENDDLSFIRTVMDGALRHFDLEVNEDTGVIYGATAKDIEEILSAVAICTSSEDVIFGCDPTNEGYTTVDVFAAEGGHLMSWIFDDPTSEPTEQ